MVNMKLLTFLLATMLVGTGGYYNLPDNAFHSAAHYIQEHDHSDESVTISLHDLEHVYEELFKKIHCDEKETVANCTVCLESLVGVSEEIHTLKEWNEASVRALYALLDIGTFCNLSSSELNALNATTALLGVIGDDSVDEIGEEEIESLLEKVIEVFAEDHHHETTTATAEHDHDHDHDHGTHEEHAQKCFGEGTLLHHMGLDHKEPISKSRIPEMAGIIVSFLAQDMAADLTCEVLPTKHDVINSLFDVFKANNTMDKEAFEQLLETLNIGSAGDSTSDSSHDDHEGHDHKKRSVEEMLLTSQCLSESALAQIYSLDLADGITKEQFVELCPILIQQQVSNSCVSVSEEVSTDPTVTNAEKYGYGTLAVIIITFLSLLGAVFFPCLNDQIVQYILSMFIAMGAATLVGDALLHLLPQALGLHSHDDHAAHGANAKVIVSDTVLLQLVVCAALYGFFVFEALMSKLQPSQAVAPTHGHSHSFDLDTTTTQPLPGRLDDKEMASNVKISDDDSTTSKACHGVTALTIMILVGDIIHNILDGVAMGVAFSQSLQDGVGTSIAIFVHELPHELGDFSIYLRSGVSKWKAVFLNLGASSTSLIGLYMGAAIGSNPDTRKWFLALTSGMFIYIGLVNMLPVLIAPSRNGNWWVHFFLKNVGMILGFAVMLILSVFEERIIHYSAV